MDLDVQTQSGQQRKVRLSSKGQAVHPARRSEGMLEEGWGKDLGWAWCGSKTGPMGLAKLFPGAGSGSPGGVQWVHSGSTLTHNYRDLGLDQPITTVIWV